MQFPHSIPYVFLKPWMAGGVGSLDHIYTVYLLSKLHFIPSHFISSASESQTFIVLFGPTLAAMCKQCAIPETQKGSKATLSS